MCLDETKQTFLFLKAFSDAGGAYGPTDGEELQGKMKDLSMKEFGVDKYADYPNDLATISRLEFNSGSIERNSDKSVALTQQGKLVLKFLMRNFIKPTLA